MLRLLVGLPSASVSARLRTESKSSVICSGDSLAVSFRSTLIRAGDDGSRLPRWSKTSTPSPTTVVVLPSTPGSFPGLLANQR